MNELTQFGPTAFGVEIEAYAAFVEVESQECSALLGIRTIARERPTPRAWCRLRGGSTFTTSAPWSPQQFSGVSRRKAAAEFEYPRAVQSQAITSIRVTNPLTPRCR